MPMTPEERSQSAKKGAETRKRKKKDEKTLSKLVDWFESAEERDHGCAQTVRAGPGLL